MLGDIHFLFLVHIFSCFFMTGVIWVVQLILYPMFQFIGEKEFSQAHQHHTEKITWIVAPIMGIELLTAVILYLQLHSTLSLLNLISVLILWAMTGLVNVPTHNHLKYESNVSKKNLVTRNWPRTLIWSLRSAVCFVVLIQGFKN